MTATTPRRRGPSTPVGGPLRDCHLYRFWVRHPDTGARVLGYVGETVRQPFRRLMEHIESQPWSDTIVGWEVDDAVYAGKDAVLAAERATVECERPIYNYEWNLANPDRVEIWRAKEQRAERDRARGVAPWVPAGPPVRSRSAGPSVAVRVLTSRWSWLAVAWVASAVGVWVAVDRAGVALSTRWHLGVAAGVPLAVAAAVWRWWATRGRRRWRRVVRRFR